MSQATQERTRTVLALGWLLHRAPAVLAVLLCLTTPARAQFLPNCGEKSEEETLVIEQLRLAAVSAELAGRYEKALGFYLALQQHCRDSLVEEKSRKMSTHLAQQRQEETEERRSKRDRAERWDAAKDAASDMGAYFGRMLVGGSEQRDEFSGFGVGFGLAWLSTDYTNWFNPESNYKDYRSDMPQTVQTAELEVGLHGRIDPFRFFVEVGIPIGKWTYEYKDGDIVKHGLLSFGILGRAGAGYGLTLAKPLVLYAGVSAEAGYQSVVTEKVVTEHPYEDDEVDWKSRLHRTVKIVSLDVAVEFTSSARYRFLAFGSFPLSYSINMGGEMDGISTTALSRTAFGLKMVITFDRK